MAKGWNRSGRFGPDGESQNDVTKVVEVSQGGWQEPQLWEISKLVAQPGNVNYKLRADDPNPGRQGGATASLPADTWFVLTDFAVSGANAYGTGTTSFRFRISSRTADGKTVKRYEEQSGALTPGQGTRWSEHGRWYFRPDHDIQVEVKDLVASESMVNLTGFYADEGRALPV